MKIILENQEINEALIAYAGSQGIDISGKDITVEFTVGRGDRGNSATIDIQESNTKSSEKSCVKEEEPADEVDPVSDGAPFDLS